MCQLVGDFNTYLNKGFSCFLADFLFFRQV